MSKLTALFLLLASTLMMGAPLSIVNGGKSLYVIAVPNEASVVERTAAAELRKHLELCTGAVLPVVSEGEVEGRAAFYLGATSKFQRLFGSYDIL